MQLKNKYRIYKKVKNRVDEHKTHLPYTANYTFNNVSMLNFACAIASLYIFRYSPVNSSPYVILLTSSALINVSTYNFN